MTWSALARAATTAARRTLAQPGLAVVSVGFYLLVTAAVTSLWRSAAEAHGGEIAGYSGLALTWYIVASEATVVAQRVRLIEEVGTEIGSGAIEPELLRPVAAVGVRLATEIGAVLPRLVACLVAGAGYAALVAGAPIATGSIGLALPSIVLAVVCNIAAQHAVAAASFWVRDAKSAWYLYHKFVFIAGGMLIPLEVLPESFESVARLLPFSAMAYAPARLASGYFEPGLLIGQALWTAVMLVAAVAMFARGERRLTAAP